MNLFTVKKTDTKVIPTYDETKIILHNDIRWIDIIKPTKKSIDMLRSEFDFHELLLEDCMMENQRSKIDDDDDYSFIVLHLPRYKKELNRLDSEEVDIFIGSNYIITLHEGELKPLTIFSEMCSNSEEARKKYMSQGSALLLYEIIKRLFDYCLPMIDKIAIVIDNINKRIFKDRSKYMLENISTTKLQIINYRKVIKPLRPVILTLEKIIKPYLPEDNEVYFDDITDKIEQIWNMLENYKEVIESLDDTFTSLTNHQANNLMRTFTIVQVITLPMVLVGGLFSMNLEGIPMHTFPSGFWIVFGMILIPTGLIALLLIINRKRWL